MQKRALLLMILLLLFMTGCANKQVLFHNYTFTGENDLWSANYTVEGSETFVEKDKVTEYSNMSKKTFTLKYKGELEDLSSVKKLEFAYETSARGETSTLEFDDINQLDKDTFILKTTSVNSVIEKKDETIFVTVTIDGTPQTIELKPSN